MEEMLTIAGVFALPQEGQKSACRFRQAEEVHFHDLAQPLRTDLGEVAGGADAGIVDQDVEPAEVLQGRLDHSLPILGQGDVGRNHFHGGSPSANAVGQLGQEFFRAGDGQHSGACNAAASARALPMPCEAPVINMRHPATRRRWPIVRFSLNKKRTKGRRQGIRVVAFACCPLSLLLDLTPTGFEPVSRP